MAALPDKREVRKRQLIKCLTIHLQIGGFRLFQNDNILHPGDASQRVVNLIKLTVNHWLVE